MSHHKVDMFRAYELAEKGVERHENADTLKGEQVKSGNPTDYTKACNTCPAPSGDTTCNSGALCTQLYTCRVHTCNPTTCPSPLANSHLVSSTCTCSRGGCNCNALRGCRGKPTYPPTCVTSGVCSYDCDDGYVWNSDTLQCELLPVVGIASKRLLVGVGT